MNCPVCRKDFGSASLQDQMVHVNRCLDENENATSASNQLASKNWTQCPICSKDGCNLNHLMKCAKDKNVLPRDVVSIVQRFEQETDTNKVKEPRAPVKKQTTAKVKKEPTAKRVTKGRKPANKTVVGTQVKDLNEVSDEPVIVSSFFNSSSIVAKDGKIILAKPPLTTQEIDRRVHCLFRNNIVQNHVSTHNNSWYQDDEQLDDEENMEIEVIHSKSCKPHSYFFKMASLQFENETTFVSRGFERFVELSVKIIEEDQSAMEVNHESLKKGFIVESSSTSRVEIKDTEGFLHRFSRLKDEEESKDLCILTANNRNIFCHSFVWKVHTNNNNLKDGPIDLSDFRHEVVNSFISYCYSGNLHIPADCSLQMIQLVTKLGCSSLLNELYTHCC